MSTAYESGKQLFLLTFLCLLSQRVPAAQNLQGDRTSDALHQLNASIESLVQRVAPAVVQIVVMDTVRPRKVITARRAWLSGENERLVRA